MGCAVLEAVSRRQNLDLVRVLGHVSRTKREQRLSFATANETRTLVLEPLTPEALEAVDVLLDFSSEPGLMEAARICRNTHTALVSGSTPLGPAAERVLDDLASEVAVCYASNFSRGLAALLSVIPELRDRLGPRFEAGVIDVHHRHKKDSPSGTARTLEAAWSRPSGHSTSVVSLRIGETTGDHALWIDGGGERIEIWHRALDRRIFAEGALDAVLWIVGKKPGRYGVAELWSSP